MLKTFLIMQKPKLFFYYSWYQLKREEI